MRARKIKRPSRSGKKKPKARQSQAASSEKRAARTRFGNVPLIPRRIELSEGRSYVHYEYDPSFQPKLPDGAVRGDIRKQLYCPLCHVPYYYYVDEEQEATLRENFEGPDRGGQASD